MTRTCVILLALVALAGPALALEVAILRPDPGLVLFGTTEVEAEVYPPDVEVDRVEFYVDGFQVGVLTEPPFRLLVDLGEENVAHDIEVVAYDASGATATNAIRTASVKTDMVIDVELQQLYLTVERDDERVLDLEEGDFRLVDNGVPQRLVTFEKGDVPFSAVLLVDSSTSMHGRKLPTALEGAKTFIMSMRPLDEAKVVLFSDRIQFETPFTNSATILGVGLGAVNPDGGTALNDAVYLAQKRLENRQGRKVIVLLSDGVDMESVLPMERIRAFTQSRQPAVYWIRLPRPGEDRHTRRFSAWRNARQHSKEIDLLRQTVEDTGGRIITISSIDEVDDAFRSLLEELRQQYVLGYYPTQTKGPGSWHDVEVQVGQRGLEIRTRKGYLEP